MMTTQSRAFTEEEVIGKIMNHTLMLIKYWNNVEGRSTEEKLHGLAFSMFTMLDGATLELPGIDLVICPHESDKDYCINEGKNYFEPEMRISTTLHDEFCAHEKKLLEKNNKVVAIVTMKYNKETKETLPYFSTKIDVAGKTHELEVLLASDVDSVEFAKDLIYNRVNNKIVELGYLPEKHNFINEHGNAFITLGTNMVKLNLSRGMLNVH